MEVTSRILFLINTSSDVVTSSVITGAGLTLCSKSKSTSSALFFGLLEAVTYHEEPKKHLMISCKHMYLHPGKI